MFIINPVLMAGIKYSKKIWDFTCLHSWRQFEFYKAVLGIQKYMKREEKKKKKERILESTLVLSEPQSQNVSVLELFWKSLLPKDGLLLQEKHQA